MDVYGPIVTIWTKSNDINGELSGAVSASVGIVGALDDNCNTLRRDSHNDGILLKISKCCIPCGIFTLVKAIAASSGGSSQGIDDDTICIIQILLVLYYW